MKCSLDAELVIYLDYAKCRRQLFQNFVENAWLGNTETIREIRITPKVSEERIFGQKLCANHPRWAQPDDLFKEAIGKKYVIL
jgi:hypothetical protein